MVIVDLSPQKLKIIWYVFNCVDLLDYKQFFVLYVEKKALEICSIISTPSFVSIFSFFKIIKKIKNVANLFTSFDSISFLSYTLWNWLIIKLNWPNAKTSAAFITSPFNSWKYRIYAYCLILLTKQTIYLCGFSIFILIFVFWSKNFDWNS